MPNGDRMRKEFEEWGNATLSVLWFGRLPDGRYGTPVIQGLYEIWQAACRAQAKRDAEICRHYRDVRGWAECCAEDIEMDAGLC